MSSDSNEFWAWWRKFSPTNAKCEYLAKFLNNRKFHFTTQTEDDFKLSTHLWPFLILSRSTATCVCEALARKFSDLYPQIDKLSIRSSRSSKIGSCYVSTKPIKEDISCNILWLVVYELIVTASKHSHIAWNSCSQCSLLVLVLVLYLISAGGWRSGCK